MQNAESTSDETADINFIRTGEFCAIRIDSRVSDVASVLGGPDNWMMNRRKRNIPQIYKYGSVEFYFSDNPPYRCNGIFIESCYDEPAFHWPRRNTLVNWPFTPLMPKALVERTLAERDI